MHSDRPLVDAAVLWPVPWSLKIRRIAMYSLIVGCLSMLAVLIARGYFGGLTPLVVLLLVIAAIVFGLRSHYRARARTESLEHYVGFCDSKNKMFAQAFSRWPERSYEKLRTLCGQEFSEVIEFGGASYWCVFRCLYDTGEFVHLCATVRDSVTGWMSWRDMLVFRDGRIECDPRITELSDTERADLALFEPFEDTVRRTFRDWFVSQHVHVVGVYQAPDGFTAQLMAKARNLVFLFCREISFEGVLVAAMGERPQWHDIRTVFMVSPFNIPNRSEEVPPDLAASLRAHSEEVFRLHDTLNVRRTMASLATAEGEQMSEHRQRLEMQFAEVEVLFNKPVHLWYTECPGGLSGAIVRILEFDGCHYWMAVSDYLMTGREFSSDCFLLWAADGSDRPGKFDGDEPLRMAVGIVPVEVANADAVAVLAAVEALGEAMVHAKGATLAKRVLARMTGRSRRLSRRDMNSLMPYLLSGGGLVGFLGYLLVSFSGLPRMIATLWMIFVFFYGIRWYTSNRD